MFKVNVTPESVEETSGGMYMNKSGIYDITINFASVEKSSGGATSVNFNVTHGQETKALYGPYVESKAGDVIKIGTDLMTKLFVLAGLENGVEIEPVTETHRVGKDNLEKDFEVIQELSDLDIKVRLQEEYSKYNGEISKRLTIKSFFDAEGASADERLNDKEVGKRLAFETERYADKITYKDDLTPEDVQAWKDSFKTGNNAAPAKKAAPKVSANRPKFNRG